MARNLKTKNTRTIGVIVEDMTIFSIPDIVDGITEHCEENNYQILLINLRLFKNTMIFIITEMIITTRLSRKLIN